VDALRAGGLALLWVLGFGFSLRQHPHLLRNDELVLRFGHFGSVRVPLEHLTAVRGGAATGHERNLGLDREALTMAVMGDTNLELRFEPSVELAVGGVMRSFTRIAFYVDDPRTATRLLRATAPSG
jgi:hypothetical protein